MTIKRLTSALQFVLFTFFPLKNTTRSGATTRFKARDKKCSQKINNIYANIKFSQNVSLYKSFEEGGVVLMTPIITFCSVMEGI